MYTVVQACKGVNYLSKVVKNPVLPILTFSLGGQE